MAPRMPSSPTNPPTGASSTSYQAATCCRIASCSIYRALNQYPYMGVWKRLYCQGSFTACRHFSMMDDGLTSP